MEAWTKGEYLIPVKGNGLQMEKKYVINLTMTKKKKKMKMSSSELNISFLPGLSSNKGNFLFDQVLWWRRNTFQKYISIFELYYQIMKTRAAILVSVSNLRNAFNVANSLHIIFIGEINFA